MRFHATKIAGVFLLEWEPKADSRGFFARTWCVEEYTAHGLNPTVVQASVSYNHRIATLRGLHYQKPPYTECKTVRCTRGAIFDVAVDMRPESRTYRQWIGCELAANGGKMLYIPDGCAHGFITLENDSEVSYLISAFYHPECSAGIRWNDPTIEVAWPVEPRVISEADQRLPLFETA